VSRLFLFFSFVVILALARFIPHPPNFSPMLALALFAGAKAPQKWMGYLAAVLALWLSDMFIGVHYLEIITGLAVVLAAGIGTFAEKSLQESSNAKKFFGWAASGFIASSLFFLITNFFVWQTSGIYPPTNEGLVNCFVMALPFFQYQVLSTWAFSLFAFGGWSGLERMGSFARQSN
jgi:hypothetical protein